MHLPQCFPETLMSTTTLKKQEQKRTNMLVLDSPTPYIAEKKLVIYNLSVFVVKLTKNE